MQKNINTDLWLSRIGLGLIFFYCLAASIFYSYFAQIHLTLQFLPFPIFVGEIVMFICLPLLVWACKDGKSFNRRTILLLGLYFGGVLLKSLINYYYDGPLTCRNAALFYYPIFAVFAYYFYQKSKIPRKVLMSLALLAAGILFFKVMVGYYWWTYVTLFAIAVWNTKSVKWRWLGWVFLAVIFLLGKEYLYRGSRSHFVSVFGTIVFLISYFGMLLVKRRNYGALSIFLISFLFFIMGYSIFSARNDISSVISLKGMIDTYNDLDRQYQVQQGGFVPKKLSVHLYNPKKFASFFPPSPSTTSQLAEAERAREQAAEAERLRELSVQIKRTGELVAEIKRARAAEIEKARPKPVATASAAPQPAASQPAAPQPVATASVTSQPAAPQLAEAERLRELSVEIKRTGELAAEAEKARPKPVATASAAPQPAASQPAAPQPVATASVTSQPVAPQLAEAERLRELSVQIKRAGELAAEAERARAAEIEIARTAEIEIAREQAAEAEKARPKPVVVASITPQPAAPQLAEAERLRELSVEIKRTGELAAEIERARAAEIERSREQAAEAERLRELSVEIKRAGELAAEIKRAREQAAEAEKARPKPVVTASAAPQPAEAERAREKSNQLREERSFDTDEGNIVFRLFVWRDMAREFIQEPAAWWWGFSFGHPQRSRSLEVLRLAELEWKRDGWITPHNSFFHIIYRAGILGFCLVGILFFMIGKLVRDFFNLNSIEGGLLVGALIYWLVLSNFLVILEFPYNAIVFWPLFGITMAYRDGLKGTAIK